MLLFFGEETRFVCLFVDGERNRVATSQSQFPRVQLIQGDQSKTAPSANYASQDENDNDTSQDENEDDASLDENDDRPLPSKTQPNPNWYNWKECREKI